LWSDVRWSQSELARRLDRAHSYVGRIETGDRRLDLPEFIEWCELLEADPVEILQRILKR
jgi:transcriptional regulator with XRE-family HTH domain